MTVILFINRDITTKGVLTHSLCLSLYKNRLFKTNLWKTYLNMKN